MSAQFDVVYWRYCPQTHPPLHLHKKGVQGGPEPKNVAVSSMQNRDQQIPRS